MDGVLLVAREGMDSISPGGVRYKEMQVAPWILPSTLTTVSQPNIVHVVAITDSKVQNIDYRFMARFLNKTSQELRMLFSVTIKCQVTNIVMNSGSQLSEL